MKKITSLLVLLLPILCLAQGTKLLRQPTIHNDQIVFIYANDLWKVSTTGGDAVRLTSDTGYEFSPHFSNDGSMIAFSAQYDGNVDVFVIAASGGEPQRMTYHPGSDVVQGWTPDNKILFRSDREARPTESTRFFTIGLKDVYPQPMELKRAAYGELSQDGKYVAYTPIMSWDPEWRNYRGGQAMPIWIVDLKTGDLQTTSQPDKERHLEPIWLDGVVYYLSERDYTSNIWSYNPATKEEKQHTFHKKFDVKSLDADASQIIYEHGGTLKLLNPKTNLSKELVINVKADMNYARPRWEDVSGRDYANAVVSPTGQRALLEYRGELFSIPKEKGSWRNITNSPAAADRYPIWSPLGDKIAWFTDASGEYGLVIADQYGANKRTIALPNPTFYFEPDWSPDGKHIAYTDTHYNIWILNVDSGKTAIVATDSYAHPNRSMNPVWSPDSKWIAFARQQQSHFKAIMAYNVDSKETVQLTDPLADAIAPVWDASGDYLYTLVSTDYGLASGWLDMSSYDPKTTRSLYAIVLSKKGTAPNLPETDEEKAVTASKDDKKEGKKDTKKKKDDDDDAKSSVTVTIDKDGIYDRAITMGLPARNYTGLAMAGKHNVLVAEAIENETGFKVHLYDIKKQKAEDFASGIWGMKSSTDGSHIILNKGGSWSISKTSGKPDLSKDGIDANVKMYVDPQVEYKQIFKEGWRYMRDFLYVDNQHGAPWDDVYKWYAPWIDHVRHRTDLNYVVDIMSGEIAIGHSYVSGGDMPDIKSVPVGLLGVDLEVTNNRYRITKILSGERWNPDVVAPLNLPGTGVNVGDYIIAINGTDLTAAMNPFKILEQTADRTINLTVSKNANGTDSKTMPVKPVSSERGLRAVDWVESNRRKVDELSGGTLAYVYVPNTSGAGFANFNRYYFSQQNKKGVVIDERNNGGGSAADYMIDVLNREPIGYFNSKAANRRPWTTPMAGIFGPKVMIINERAGSGGDLLPYMFKQQNIGPVVGTRTWGGLVGTWDTPPFIDGGRMVAPRGGFYDLDGNWAVEGEGVAPDIEVIQDPKSTIAGKDPQLERAVQEALNLLKTQEFIFKPEPAAPVRSKRPAGYEKEQ